MGHRARARPKGYAAAHRYDGKSDGEFRELLGDKFPQAPLPLNRLHRGLDRSSGGGSLDGRALGALHVGERTEQELIAAIVNKITELKPQLATLNGSSFDLPVLNTARWLSRLVHGRLRNLKQKAANTKTTKIGF